MSSANKMSAAEVLAALRELARENGVELTGIIIAPTQLQTIPSTSLSSELTDLHRRILKASPAPTDARISMKKLARAAKSGYHWYFRKAVNELVDLGLLTRGPNGIRKAN